MKQKIIIDADYLLALLGKNLFVKVTKNTEVHLAPEVYYEVKARKYRNILDRMFKDETIFELDVSSSKVQEEIIILVFRSARKSGKKKYLRTGKVNNLGEIQSLAYAAANKKGGFKFFSYDGKTKRILKIPKYREFLVREEEEQDILGLTDEEMALITLERYE